jgi:hypothetical protein
VDEINSYLKENYQVGKNKTAYINICKINSHYNNLCTDRDKKLPYLVQSWLVPPIEEYYDEIQQGKYVLIGVGCTYGFLFLCGVCLLALVKKHNPYGD